MKLTYIYHSGFAVETEHCIVIMDFYEDPAHVIPALLSTEKSVYVLASHFHPDHYNPEVLEWQKQNSRITYVLSKDILRHRRAPKDAANWLAKGGIYTDTHITIQAFGSTDSGDSFYIEADGHTIFHAGDLNNWHWQDDSTQAEVAQAEKMYLGELKDIRKVVQNVDVAFFPVDARIGSNYMRGAEQFIERIPCRLFVPMHFSSCGFASVAPFAPHAEAHGAKFWALSRDGEQIVWNSELDSKTVNNK